MKLENISKEIKIYTSGSFLSRIWRKIVLNDGYYSILPLLMNDYIHKEVIKASSNAKISINRTNIYDKIMDDSMTWKNLLFLLTEIIKVKELETTMNLEIGDKKSKYVVKGLTSSVIPTLWDLIVKDIKSLDTLIEEYHIREKDNKNKVNKTNLLKKISSSHDMTWKTFMFLIDEILIAREFQLSVKIKNFKGTYNTHSMTYRIRS